LRAFGAVTASLAAALLACSAVPTLRFEVADATTDDGATDAGGDSSSDQDSEETANTCPTSPPPGTTICCDTTPCNGDCGEAGCSLCQLKCGPQPCCAKLNMALCRPSCM
jgi:hypothetical protein